MKTNQLPRTLMKTRSAITTAAVAAYVVMSQSSTVIGQAQPELRPLPQVQPQPELQTLPGVPPPPGASVALPAANAAPALPPPTPVTGPRMTRSVAIANTPAAQMT